MKSYFSIRELQCRCGCALYNINKEALDTLNHAREIAEIPFIINRGCSCVEHNRNVGGSDTSSHIASKQLECTAFDIKCTTSSDRSVIVEALFRAGFTRIGIAKSFIHADLDKNKTSNVIWLYS